MNKKIIEKMHKWKKKFCRVWKRGLATWEEYRNIIRAYRNATRKPKAHLELILWGKSRTTGRAFLSMSVAK